MDKKTHQKEVIIFTRYPEPGNVKKRLIPYLGKAEAARVHRLLSERIIRHVLQLEKNRSFRISVHYTGGTRKQMQDWLRHPVILEEQRGNDVGQRMAAALRAACARGAHRTVLIGTDCPAMNPDLIAVALDELLHHTIVLGPAYDGGYYLIGLNCFLPEEKIDLLFQDIDWGTSRVFQQTIRKIEENGFSFATLSPIHDVDRPEDLEHFHYYSNPQ